VQAGQKTAPDQCHCVNLPLGTREPSTEDIASPPRHVRKVPKAEAQGTRLRFAVQPAPFRSIGLSSSAIGGKLVTIPAAANLEYSVIHFLGGVLIHGGVWASLTK